MDSYYEPAAGAATVQLGGPGVVISSPGSLLVPNHPRAEIATRITIRTDGIELHIDGVELFAMGDLEVTTDDLRNVRLVETIRTCLPEHVTVHAWSWAFPTPDYVADAVRKAWPSMTSVSNVAQTYNFARALRLAPIKAVMENYGVSRATAHRWVNLAKDRGEIADGAATDPAE